MRRIPQLDGLRALAVGLVIINHVYYGCRFTVSA